MSLTRFRFTDAAIRKLPGPEPNSTSKAIEYTDLMTPGLKLQVNKQGVATFYFRYIFQGQKRALRIGQYPGISLQSAREKVTASRGLLDSGKDPQAPDPISNVMPSFADFTLHDYLSFAKQTKRSYKADESKLRIHLIPKFGHLPLDALKTQAIQLYIGDIAQSHTPATANRHLALLSKIYGTAIDWGIVTKNPCSGIKQFAENNRRDVYLKPEQIQRLLVAMDVDENTTAMAALKLLLLTGVRREEALQAKWAEVDLENGLWWLPVTKAGKSRHVVLNDAAKSLLAALPRYTNCPFVFPGKDPSKPICNVTKAFGRVLAAAGLERIRIHDLRHTFASLLVSNGASLYQVQTLLGHANAATTQRYAHLAADSLRETSQLVGQVISNVNKVSSLVGDGA